MPVSGEQAPAPMLSLPTLPHPLPLTQSSITLLLSLQSVITFEEVNSDVISLVLMLEHRIVD